jgi:F-type H+-transporting ATPase subunit epsilon
VGDIGVLANHVPVMARLVPSELRLHISDSETVRFAQGEGWLEVFANRALVLIGEAVAPDQLDPAELKQRIEDAEQRLGEADEGTAAHEQAALDKRRAETFLALAESS